MDSYPLKSVRPPHVRMIEWKKSFQYGKNFRTYRNIGFNSKVSDAASPHHELDQLVLWHLKVESVRLTVGVCDAAPINFQAILSEIRRDEKLSTPLGKIISAL